MELTLTRTTKRKGCTLGVLAVDGKEMCDTMEPTWRDLKKERKAARPSPKGVTLW